MKGLGVSSSYPPLMKLWHCLGGGGGGGGVLGGGICRDMFAT